MRKFIKWVESFSIQSKLVVTTLLAVLLPLMIVASLTLSRFVETSRSDAEENLEQIVTNILALCQMQYELEQDLTKAGAIPPSRAPLYTAIAKNRVGHTGYAYTMNSEGRLKIHPAKVDQIIIDSQDSDNNYYIREMVKNAVKLPEGAIGTIRYPWVNPELGETTPRMKLTKYVYFPEWDWIIAAGSYESEIYQAANQTREGILVIFGFTIIFVTGLTMILARRLARPIKRMSHAARLMADGELSVRVYLDREDEVGEMANSFNHMASQIQVYTENLQGLVAERTRELKRTKEYFESMVQSSADMIITTNRAGKVTFANKATYSSLNYPAGSLIGRHVSMLYPKGFQKAREIMDKLKIKSSFSNYEMPLIRHDGTTMPILTSAALLRGEDDKVIGTVGVFTDITERKHLEQQLRRTQANLVQAGKMRAMGDLVSGVAHEMNNPLMASQSIVHVMKGQIKPDDPMARKVEIIEKCNLRMEKIINHLREFSRADEKQLKLMDFNEPVENVLMITGQQLLNHNITLHKELDPDLPQILGDANELEQVYLNLVANAKDAMEGIKRQKELTIKTFASSEGDKIMVNITVTDTGSGIEEDVMEKIFNPFFSTKDASKGTGLGLAITYGIIEDHAGRVDVKTRVGAGTTFKISIPAAG